MVTPSGVKAGDGPAVLQLRNWSHLQLDLSEFSEVFISPTRELVLLLSYQCEALLLPLIAGAQSLPLYAPARTTSSGSDSLCISSCPREPIQAVQSNVFPDGSISSKHCHVISDVKSLAWGCCGDGYNQNLDAIFKELLVVSGDRGVTVHAFRCLDHDHEMGKPVAEEGFVQGKWVEWAPLDERSSSNAQASGSVWDADRSNEKEVSPQSEFVNHESPNRSFTSRTWLRTFLAEIETTESKGIFLTKFPEMSSFPSSAEVISFSISCSTPVFLDFLYRDNNSLSNISSPYIPYKCCKVFSSSSHRLIGMVMAFSGPISVETSERNAKSVSRVLVAVAMVYQWGIQWVSSIKLNDSYLREGPECEWTDFQFLDSFLVCLNRTGLIFIWGATTGKFVACLDVLRCCGIKSRSHIGVEQPKLSAESDDSHEEQKYQRGGGVCAEKKFRRLMVVSNSMLLAALDECGVIYVICVDDYVSKEHYSCNKTVTHFQHLGILASWEVAGSEIGGQKVFPDLLNCQCSNISWISNQDLPSIDGSEEVRIGKKQKRHVQGKGAQLGSYLSCFSRDSKSKGRCVSSETYLTPIRKIFLPPNGSNEVDAICFSPLGITRLVKRCNLEDQKAFRIVHMCLHVASTVQDDRRFCVLEKEQTFVGEAIGCSFQGYLYLVSQDGLSVVLPSIHLSSGILPVESIEYWRPSIITCSRYQMENLLAIKNSREMCQPWKIEILDRTLLYEGPDEADRICLENGWDLKITRMRRLQLALDYLKLDEIELSLEMLVDVNLAEEGIMRLLFTAVHHVFCQIGGDNELAMASRFLALAARFATKMVRRYGLLEHKRHMIIFQGVAGSSISPIQTVLRNNKSVEVDNSGRLHEMAYFLEVIRNLQCRLDAKCRRRGQGVVDGGDHSLGPTQSDMSQDDSLLPVLPSESTPSGVADAFEVQNQRELFSQSFPESELSSNNFDNLVLSPLESLDSSTSYMHAGNLQELLAHASEGGNKRRQFIPLENPKDMFARWEVNNLDLKNVVGDALRLGRLPLAVLQLHLQHLKDLATEKEPYDTFNEVQDVGRAIAYDLFCKGQIGLAVATLQRLGEDIEVSLKQLVFGTLRRSFRMQVSEEMNRRGFLGPYEWRILDRLSLIERLYPSSSFWGTYIGRQKQFNQVSSTVTLARENGLKLVCCYAYNNYCIKCGEVDGAVIGSWANIGEKSSVPEVDEDNVHSGYWAGAAVWTDAWDQTTVDRVVLDQPFIMGVHVLWESQLEYHSCHNDWEEVSKLLDMIPESLLSDGNLQINLDGLRAATVVGSNKKLPDNRKYFCLAKELDEMCMVIPNIKIFRFSASNKCPLWLRKLMELKLAKNFVFMKEYWEDTGEIVPLLAHAGFIINTSKITVKIESTENLPDLDYPYTSRGIHRDTVLALHKVFLLFCAQYNLPNFFDLYLDHHKLALDNASLGSILEAAGECQWAKWLLLSRIRGREYDASFSNARSIISHNMVLGSNIGVLEIDDIIRTVDDMAEGGGEIVALATLMYAPAPVQKCLCSGSVNRHWSSSAQCTLENLRPGLQQFPTLWHTLVAMCFGQDSDVSSLTPNTRTVFSKSPLSGYLNWRDNLFSSAGGDTSLLQMLPCWLSKAVRKLVQLFVQGPLGWQSLSGAIPAGESILRASIDFDVNSNENTKVNAISWEATIQKNIEQELYASSFEEKVFGIEHHLHRGRALAAFNYLLGLRAQKLKLAHGDQERSGASMRGLTNVHSEVQTLLAPLTQDEESLLSSVIPLAILHFEDSVLVASCAFLLELCGLPASIIHVDVAALRRISSFFKSSDSSEHLKHFMPNSPMLRAVSNEGDFTDSLARALADDYLHNNDLSIIKLKDTPLRASTSRRTSRALMAVLQHLEKVSLPSMVEGQTCGLWLRTGNGDGAELRSQQKAGSQHWNLVTVFCQMHHLPISTKYLALLANDDDWVGFLTEAQIEGCPFDLLIQVAYKEFTDPRLKRHILTVLKSVQSRKKAVSSTNSAPTGKNDGISVSTESEIMMPVELFGLLMQCEKQKNPGKALLLRAKDLRWSLLAMIASCFPDVSPLSCLTVWLEITAASETSSIKVNDISSQIAQNVGAAVEATNALPTSSRTVTFHYNRKNAKRRHLMEPTTGNAMANAPSYVSCTSNSIRFPISQEIVGDEEKKMQANEQINVLSDPDEQLGSLTKMVAVLCEQHLFLPLLRAFEMFLPSCSLLPFIRSLQAFSQMRLLEASAHLASFSSRIKEEPQHIPTNLAKDGQIGMTWISSTAVKAAEAVLSTCPSAYERRCLLQLLAAADFGDGGTASTSFRRLYWKINLAEPSLRQGDEFFLGNKPLDDAALLMALENNGHWEQARSWARQLELSGAQWKSVVHHVTETQAEAMVAEWKEFLWDVPEERAALWGHCQTLFLRYSFPSLQAGLFFLKHAEAVEKDIPARELHEILLLSLQWLSGSITQCHPVFPLHLLREIETRVWLLAVESEAQLKNEGDFISPNPNEDLASGNSSSMIEQTATVVTRMDIHLNSMRTKSTEKNDARESFQANVRNPQASDSSYLATASSSTKTKRRAKSYLPSRRPLVDSVDKNNDPDDNSSPPFRYFQSQQENVKLEASMSGWEERVGPAELERAVLSLLEFGQIAAAKQLQQKLSPTHVPSEFLLVDAALKLAAISTPSSSEISITILDPESLSVIKSHNILTDNHIIDPLQVLEVLATKCAKGSGRGLCKRIISVVKTANILGLSFAEAFEKRPIELLQLLSLKAQDSLEEAKLLMQTHSMPPASTARILAESFLKGLLAAHRGGYMDSQKEEGPAPLLWRFSDFLKWAELCPSEPEIGHALMRLVITGQEIPHACEVELLILSHHFYKSSACLDGVDVLIALAATRVESYVAEGDFSCLARLVTGVSNYRALNFMLGILIENGQLELLLQKYSVADTTTGSAESVQGFRMAVLTSLKHFNPHDLDAFSMVYNHFDMKHETSSLLESRSMRSLQQWLLRRDKERNEELLETMRFYIEAAEVYATIDAGNKTRWACAQASLISLQIRIPDFNWLSLSETNARRVLVEQSRFQEALIMAEAYGLNQPGEWAPVLWNQMLKPELIERFMAEFVAVYPLQPAMLMELARFYRAEVAARGDQSHFSAWLSPGGPPAEWARQVGKSFRSLLKRTRDLRVRMQLATVATGFGDIVDAFMKALDKVPDAAGPLVLRKGHGGAYLPLM